ncbi:peptidylprolyl isomerase [Tissierella praeacuta]|uniref:peptidylprolyl isomerase n=1 Tax=Tissierella praeacuta TaxID=43131 RepID=UPI00333EADE4
MRKIDFILIILVIIIVLGGCKNDAGKIINGYTQIGNLKLEQVQIPKVGEEIAVITTNMGEIKMRLFPEIAPKAVGNFKTLVKKGFYDGIKFTRIEDNFLIQIGDNPEYPEGKSIFGEFFEDEYDLNYRHITGSVGLAKKEANKNHSNFNIIVQDGIDEEYVEAMKELDEEGYPKDVIKAYEILGGVPRLDLRYTIFAQVFYGMDTVMAINKVTTNPVTKEPIEDIIIEKAEIVLYEGK